MIKARGEINGEAFLLVGFSKLNCERLLAGKPITFKFSEIGITELKGNFLFVGGETERDILKDLQEHGFDMQGADVHFVNDPKKDQAT